MADANRRRKAKSILMFLELDRELEEKKRQRTTWTTPIFISNSCESSQSGRGNSPFHDQPLGNRVEVRILCIVSSPDVGSSRNTTGGILISWIATQRRRFCGSNQKDENSAINPFTPELKKCILLTFQKAIV